METEGRIRIDGSYDIRVWNMIEKGDRPYTKGVATCTERSNEEKLSPVYSGVVTPKEYWWNKFYQ